MVTFTAAENSVLLAVPGRGAGCGACGGGFTSISAVMQGIHSERDEHNA